MLKAWSSGAHKAVAALMLGVVCALLPQPGMARNQPSTGGLDAIRIEQLPLQGRQTYALIRQGGPFPTTRMAPSLAIAKGCCLSTSAATTASTPSERQVRATGVPGALCVEACSPGRRMPATTPATTTPVFAKLSNEPLHPASLPALCLGIHDRATASRGLALIAPGVIFWT